MKTNVGDSLTCTRTQIPLTLDYASSIHKAQGATLESGVVYVGPDEYAVGLLYTALSRFRRLSDMALSPPPSIERLE